MPTEQMGLWTGVLEKAYLPNYLSHFRDEHVTWIHRPFKPESQTKIPCQNLPRWQRLVIFPQELALPIRLMAGWWPCLKRMESISPSMTFARIWGLPLLGAEWTKVWLLAPGMRGGFASMTGSGVIAPSSRLTPSKSVWKASKFRSRFPSRKIPFLPLALSAVSGWHQAPVLTLRGGFRAIA